MLIEAPEPHTCKTPLVRRRVRVPITLPNGRETTREKRVIVPLRSLYRCEECYRRWILVPHKWGPRWMQLRWYHRTTIEELNMTPKEIYYRKKRRAKLATFLAAVLISTFVFSVVIATVFS